MLVAERWNEALESYLAPMLSPGGSCRITGVDRITVGQSRGMYRVELECQADGQARATPRTVVVRVEQFGLLGTSSSYEVKTMRALLRAGLPVAPVVAYEPSHEPLGQPFFVMEFVAGETTFTPESIDHYIETLHRVHELDWQAAGVDFLTVPATPREGALLEIERWYGIYRDAATEPVPLLEEGGEWLRIHAPESRRISIVHGDPGPGNYLHLEGRVTALTDWEFAHLGDPDEDWAYLIAMRGARAMAEDAWLERIERIAGVRIDPGRLRYWKAFNAFKSACIDVTAMKVYVAEQVLTPNMLLVGTQIHWASLKRLWEWIGQSQVLG